jgi:hypothetical protein
VIRCLSALEVPISVCLTHLNQMVGQLERLNDVLIDVLNEEEMDAIEEERIWSCLVIRCLSALEVPISVCLTHLAPNALLFDGVHFFIQK